VNLKTSIAHVETKIVGLGTTVLAEALGISLADVTDILNSILSPAPEGKMIEIERTLTRYPVYVSVDFGEDVKFINEQIYAILMGWA